MIRKVIKIVVVNLIFLALLGVTGCSREYAQYHNLSSAFVRGCEYNTMQSSLSTQGDTITIHATCYKDR